MIRHSQLWLINWGCRVERDGPGGSRRKLGGAGCHSREARRENAKTGAESCSLLPAHLGLQRPFLTQSQVTAVSVHQGALEWGTDSVRGSDSNPTARAPSKDFTFRQESPRKVGS